MAILVHDLSLRDKHGSYIESMGQSQQTQLCCGRMAYVYWFTGLTICFDPFNWSSSGLQDVSYVLQFYNYCFVMYILANRYLNLRVSYVRKENGSYKQIAWKELFGKQRPCVEKNCTTMSQSAECGATVVPQGFLGLRKRGIEWPYWTQIIVEQVCIDIDILFNVP
jgi:hypothetical protein